MVFLVLGVAIFLVGFLIFFVFRGAFFTASMASTFGSTGVLFLREYLEINGADGCMFAERVWCLGIKNAFEMSLPI